MISRQAVAAAFGFALRQERQKRGMQQNKLAELAELNPAHVCYIERGERGVALVTFVSLAAGLSLTPTELMAIFQLKLESLS